MIRLLADSVVGLTSYTQQGANQISFVLEIFVFSEFNFLILSSVSPLELKAVSSQFHYSDLIV